MIINNNRGDIIWSFAFSQIMFVVFISALCFQNKAAAEEKLKAGTWKGTYLTRDGSRYKIKYIVSYGDDKKSSIKIKMINRDLEPESEFTWELSDIVINKNMLRFKIPKKFETKECILQKTENGGYEGQCRSIAGSNKEVSEITMVPPP